MVKKNFNRILLPFRPLQNFEKDFGILGFPEFQEIPLLVVFVLAGLRAYSINEIYSTGTYVVRIEIEKINITSLFVLLLSY